MGLGRGQAPERSTHFLIGKARGFLHGPPLDQDCRHAGTRDGGPAALGSTARLLNSPIPHPDRDAHDVAARNRSGFTDAISVGQVANVARIEEMIEDQGVVREIVVHSETSRLRSERSACS